MAVWSRWRSRRSSAASPNATRRPSSVTSFFTKSPVVASMNRLGDAAPVFAVNFLRKP